MATIAVLCLLWQAETKPVQRPKRVTAPVVKADEVPYYALPGGGFIYK